MVDLTDTLTFLRCTDDADSLSTPCECSATGTCEDADLNCDGEVDSVDGELQACLSGGDPAACTCD